MKESIKIAIYSRKSKYSDKGNSCGNQIELAMEYINMHYPNNKYNVEYVIYEDEGFSGGNINRPNFQKMLKEEREKHFDVLICYRLDRISRNIADFSNLMTELSKYHTDFISIKEQFDTRTPMGRAMMYIASVFAQLEREVIAERIRDNMIELAKTGRWLGGETPTGYNSERFELVDVYEEKENNTIENKKKKACKLIENPKEIHLIDIIAKKYLELKSLSALETYLMQQDVVSRTGVYFSVTRLRAILTNPVYCIYDKDIEEYFERKGVQIYIDESRKKVYGQYGIISYNKQDGEKNARDIKEWIIAVGLHPGRIKGIDWIRIQELLEKNSEKRYRAKCKNEALFSGILRCNECGSYMRPKSTGNKPKDSTQRRYYYTCELKEKSKGAKCKGANIVGITMDTLIIQKLKEIFVPNSDVYRELKKVSLSKSTKDNDEEIQNLTKTYNKNTEAIKNLIEKLKYMDIDVVEYINEEIKKLKKENQDIKKNIDKLQKEIILLKKEKSAERKGADIILDIVNNSFEQFDNLDLKLKKDILKLLIQDIRGNGDKIEINFLNTKIEEDTKKLFSDMVKEDNLKNLSNISIKTESNSYSKDENLSKDLEGMKRAEKVEIVEGKDVSKMFKKFKQNGILNQSIEMCMKEYNINNICQEEIKDYIDQFIYYRKKRGYTQEQVGQVIGTTGKEYSKYEKRIRKFKNKEKIDAVAKFLEIEEELKMLPTISKIDNQELKTFLREKEINNTEFSKKIGVSRRSVVDWVNKNVEISEENCIKIIKFMENFEKDKIE